MSAPELDAPDAAVASAIVALRSGDEEAALPAVAAAVRSHPGHARLRQALGMLHRARGELGRAIEAFDAAAALAPDDASIAHVRARACLEAGRPAAGVFERAAQLAPHDGSARLGRASALLAEQGLAAAIAALDAELAGMPLWADGQALRAKLRWMSGDREHFTEGLEWALLGSPGELALWSALLAVLAQAERPEAVLDAIARARSMLGANALFDLYEASAHDDLGDLAASAQLFEALGEPQHIDVALLKLRHLFRARRPEEAATLAERWAATPARALVWPYLSIAWRLTGNERLAWLEGDDRLVGVYDLGAAAGPLDALAARLRTLHFAAERPLDQSVRGGTQTDGALLSRLDPEFAPLRAAFAAAVRRHIDALPPIDPDHETLAWRRDRPVRFAGSWSVRLAGAGRHANHVHPAGWFSSAFYVALPDAAERGPDPAGWLSLGAPPAELGLDLPPLRRIEPKPGRLVLFPSTMWHGTEPFAAGERLTMAFDVARPG